MQPRYYFTWGTTCPLSPHLRYYTTPPFLFILLISFIYLFYSGILSLYSSFLVLRNTSLFHSGHYCAVIMLFGYLGNYVILSSRYYLLGYYAIRFFSFQVGAPFVGLFFIFVLCNLLVFRLGPRPSPRHFYSGLLVRYLLFRVLCHPISPL